MARNIMMTLAKEELKRNGIKVLIKDMHSMKMTSFRGFGHVEGWTMDTYVLTMKDGRQFEFEHGPTGIYSGRYILTLLKKF